MPESRVKMGNLAASFLLDRIAKNPSPGHHRDGAADDTGRREPDQLEYGGKRSRVMDRDGGDPRHECPDRERSNIAAAVDCADQKRRWDDACGDGEKHHL